MSPTARKDYYKHIADHRKTKGLNIPIICSHASVGNAPSNDFFINDEKKNKDDESYFNTSTLSLNNEDINEIIDSDGLIGIVLHEGRIADKDAMKEERYDINGLQKDIKKAQKKIARFQKEMKTPITEGRRERVLEKINEKLKFIEECGNKMREGFVNMVLANMYKIVEVYADHNPQKASRGWDHLAIGSDFDGMINKLDYLGTANEFPLLDELLVKFLKNPVQLSEFDNSWDDARLKELQFGISPEELVAKVMSTNADEFLRKYFNEEYLKNEIHPKPSGNRNLIA